jgi:hypothetical protein
MQDSFEIRYHGALKETVMCYIYFTLLVRTPFEHSSSESSVRSQSVARQCCSTDHTQIDTMTFKTLIFKSMMTEYFTNLE